MRAIKPRAAEPIHLERVSRGLPTSALEGAKPARYADRVEQYAEARRRNRRSACREAGKELKSRVEVLRKRGTDADEDFLKSA